MTPEQLQAAYDEGYQLAFENAEGEATLHRRRIAEAAGLVEVARQQAERDAQVVLDMERARRFPEGTMVLKLAAAAEIRAQFAASHA